jgi:hypothetical protein
VLAASGVLPLKATDVKLDAVIARATRSELSSPAPAARVSMSKSISASSWSW